MLLWFAKCLMLRGPTQMSNGDGDGDLHYTTPALEVGSDGPDASMVGGRGQRCVCQAGFWGWLASSLRKSFCCNQTFPVETTGMVRLGQGGRSEMEGRA